MKRYFHSHFESIVFLAPILLFPIAIYDCFQRIAFSRAYGPGFIAFGLIVLFNSFHIPLSFFNALMVKRTNDALRHSIANHKFKFIFTVICLVILGILPSINTIPLVSDTIGNLNLVSKVVLFFAVAMAAHHALWQIRGIGNSLIEDKKSFNFKKDRFEFALLLFLIIFQGTATQLIPKNSKILFDSVLFGLILTLSIYILLNSFFKRQHKRLLFISRILYFPLSIFSPLVFGFKSIFHGLEYINYYKNLGIQNTDYRPDTMGRLFAIFTTIITTLPLLITNVSLIINFESIANSHVYAAAVALNQVFVTIHNYLDEQVFAFRRPAVAESIHDYSDRQV